MPPASPEPVLPRPRPERVTLEGRYVRLEPLDAARHAAGLYEVGGGPAGEPLYQVLADLPPRDIEDLRRKLAVDAAREDPLAFAVAEPRSGTALGRQSLMRIEPAHGVIEIGSILWGPAMSRSRRATEAFQLAASYVFDTLGYRRLEWKCNARNLPSRAAALRFGFRYEGLFRQHMWIKGRNRDSAWFGMTDGDWAALSPVYRDWLDPANFDAAGRQRRGLRELAAAAGIPPGIDGVPA